MLSLLLASVLTTCAAQALYALVVLREGRYSIPVRYAIAVLFAASSAGALWFILTSLTGEEGLLPALVFAGCQALAATLVIGGKLRGVIRSDSMAEARMSKRMDRVEGKQDRDLQVSEQTFSMMEDMQTEQSTVRDRLVIEQAKVRDALDAQQDVVRDALDEQQDEVKDTKEKRERELDERRDES